jgi:diguanylate cyclase (GGDEF)-like protein
LSYEVRAVALDLLHGYSSAEQVRYNYHSYEIRKFINLSLFLKKIRIWYSLFSLALLVAVHVYLKSYLVLIILVVLLNAAHCIYRYYRPVAYTVKNALAVFLTSLDFLLICLLVCLTGGIVSIFHIAYCLPVLACTIRFGIKSGFSSLRLAVLLSCLAIAAPLPEEPIPALFYFLTGTGTLAFIIWTVGVLIKEELKLREELYTASVTDHLTGLYHSGYLRERLQEEIFRCRREGGRFAIIFLDLDHFKMVNDEYGHIVGDKVLKHITMTLKEAVRGNETLARFGGDEFLLLMPGADREQAEQALRRLCDAVAENPFSRKDGLPLKIGISGGVAEYPLEGDSIERLLQVADQQMYRQKG